MEGKRKRNSYNNKEKESRSVEWYKRKVTGQKFHYCVLKKRVKRGFKCGQIMVKGKKKSYSKKEKKSVSIEGTERGKLLVRTLIILKKNEEMLDRGQRMKGKKKRKNCITKEKEGKEEY